MIKLVLADIDNTLVPLGHDHVSDRTLAAIHACLDAGLVFAPASGRNRSEVAGFLCNDEATYQTAVLVNGQEVYLCGSLARQVALDPEALRRLEGIVRGKRHCALLAYRPDGFCDWVGDEPDQLGIFIKEAMRGGARRQRELPGYPVVKAGLIALYDVPEEQALREELLEACPELDFLNTVHCWFDVVPRGWNKARGIEVLEQELGLTPDEVCVFGDAENDLAMFAHVTHSCAVANATPEALAAARWHVGASADDGVAVALEQLADAARTGTTPAFMR